MVVVELAGDVIVSEGYVRHGFVLRVTASTPVYLVVVRGVVMVVVSVEMGGVLVVGVLDSIIVDFDPRILIGGPVGQG